jgi:hypothetical protein
VNANLKKGTIGAAVALLFGAVSLANLPSASAAKRPRPAPTTTTPPTTVAPPPASVPVPSSFSVTSNIPDNLSVAITPATQLGDAELLSGPTSGGPAIVLVGDGGRVSFLRLSENSDFTFRYRNKIFVSSTQSFVFSPWVTFSFRTPTFDSLRPAAPANLRVVARTATTVTVRWDAVNGTIDYGYSLNGGPQIRTNIPACIYCAPTDPLQATFPRPAIGSSVLFSVVAIASPIGPVCQYCFPDQRFTNSLPSTLQVTNS